MKHTGHTGLAAALLATALTTLPAATAHAESVTVTDPRDAGAPAGLDIVGATFTNTGRDLGGVVRLADLGGHGKAGVEVITSDGADLMELNLYVKRRRDGSTRSWATYSDYDVARVPCDVRRRWGRSHDRIALFVDTRCLRDNRVTRGMDLTYTVMDALTLDSRRVDRSPRRDVGRN